MRFRMVLFAILIATPAMADDVPKKSTGAPTQDLTGNRRVRLVGAVIGQTPGQNLGASFVEIEPTAGQEFAVRFPAHSQTRHEQTLTNIIYSTVPFAADSYKLREPQFEVIFSIPKDAQERAPDFDRWYLASIKPLEGKNEQPQDAEKGLPGAAKMPIIAGPENRAVQLIGMRFSENRRHDRIAKFVEVDPQKGSEFEFALRPAGPTPDQTIADVAHTRTILTLINSSFSYTSFPNPGYDAPQQPRRLFDIAFSIPQDAHGYGTDFTRWSLLSIKLSNAKNEQPKPADK